MELLVLVIISLSVTSCLSIHHHVRYDGKTEVWEGEPFEISCVISSDDKSGWTVNSSLIAEDNALGYTLNERTIDPYYQELEIEVKSAQLHHEGDYRCNHYSRESHHIHILPSFTEGDQNSKNDAKKEASVQKPENEYVLETGKTYQFDCFSAKGKDTPITWYKNGKRIVEHSESNIILSGLSLIIENAQDDDAGLYMCTVETPFVTGFNDIGRIFYLNSPPKIMDFPAKKSIIRKHTLHLECKAQGFPQPQITWYIGNINASFLKETDNRITIYPLSGGQPLSHLSIQNITESDGGLYTCQANNSIDSGRSTHSDEESVFVYVREIGICKSLETW